MYVAEYILSFSTMDKETNCARDEQMAKIYSTLRIVLCQKSELTSFDLTRLLLLQLVYYTNNNIIIK